MRTTTFRDVLLEEIAEIKSGVGFPISMQGCESGDFPFAKVGDISNRARSGEQFISDAPNWVKNEDLSTLKFTPFPTGTIVFAKIGEAIRKNFRAVSTRPMLFDNNVMGVIPQEERVDTTYLYFYLRTLDFYHLAGKTTVPAIRKSTIEKLKIPLPPLEEQRRIAAILDKADGVRRKRKEAIRLTEELLKSTFLEMFGYSSDESVSIGELLDKGVLLLHKDGNHGSNYPRTSEFGIEGIPFLSANCFSDSGEMITDNVKFLSESKANKLKLGWLEHSDVLLAHNATVGRVALYDGRYKQALVGTSLTIFRPHREYLLPEFLFGVLRSEMFQKQLAHNMEQSTRNQVPITAQRDLKIKLAPLKKQLKFKELFHHVMNISKKYESSNQESENLFNSLLQKAFRGEL
jgi:type I restriction enzyme S subunit